MMQREHEEESRDIHVEWWSLNHFVITDLPSELQAFILQDFQNIAVKINEVEGPLSVDSASQL